MLAGAGTALANGGVGRGAAATGAAGARGGRGSAGATGAAAPVGPHARRFLDLTGDAPQTRTSSGRSRPGRLANAAPGSGVAGSDCANEPLPNGWCLTPAGQQVDVLRFPLGLAPSSDGSKILVSSDSGGPQGLSVIDAAAPAPVALPTPSANLFMGVLAVGDKVYASGGNADRLFRFRLAGPVAVHQDATEAAVFPTHALTGLAGVPPLPAGDGIPVSGYPGNLLRSPDGSRLYVAGTLAEATGTAPGDVCPDGQAACSRVSVLDTATDRVVARIPVGLEAYGLALSANTLYVSNWADQAGRGGGTGTVSVVDLDPAHGAPHEVARIAVGQHPSALQLSADSQHLFVANTNDDTISVIDTASRTVTAVQSVQPDIGGALGPLQTGAHPDAFALSPDGATLFVALAGLNAVEVLDGHTGGRLRAAATYIPTGWYPSALAVTGTAQHYRLWVANAKGHGFGPGYNLSVFQEGTTTGGTVGAVSLPAGPGDEAAWTRQVRANDHLDGGSPACPPGRRSQVLCPPPGKSSPVRHVVYIVTENKTFDQYFGDINLTPAAAGGAAASQHYEADPTYAIYGQPFTPNHHALAARYELGDNFYSDAEVSVTGHSWTSGAIATDHNEKTWPADYDQGIRGNHGGGDPHKGAPATGKAVSAAADQVLQDPKGGYLFDSFIRAGAVPPLLEPDGQNHLTMAIYGEHTAAVSGDLSAYKAKWTPGPGQAPVDWKAGDIQYFDTCRAGQFINGRTGGGAFPDSSAQNPVSGDTTARDCEKRGLDPQYNLAHWTEVMARTGQDLMPNFIYMSLPVNHTVGTNVGNPTPASMVADNDYAVGLIVEALSKSPFWGSTVVMQTEDDTQIAGDHVSPLRDYLAVSSPWAQPGALHARASMPALLRTIETIFGVEPASLNDRLAQPIYDAFRADVPDQAARAPYTAVKPLVPFAVNQPGAPGAALSAQMDFRDYDRVDEATLNAILEADAHHTPLRLPPARR
ncbi:MAG: beta-propeller fold lactonase family protein [Acidimicrobiales bacterium]